jgi:hypothetical protein
MNQPRQFVSLFAFQAKLNPYIWFMMLILAAPSLLVHSSFKNYHENLSSLLDAPNLFFVGIFGLWILAPEMAQTRWAGTTSSMGSLEFLLPLAINRRVLYRSRVTLFYLVVLLIPVVMLLLALRSPNLVATEYAKPARVACLNSVPGSVLQPDPSGSTSPLLHLPGGKVLVGEWHLWMFMAAAFLSQMAFCFLFPLKHGKAIFYTLFLGMVMVPLAIDLMRVTHDFFPFTERLFFIFAGHQVIFLLASAAIFIAGQLWCEQRFIRQQY